MAAANPVLVIHDPAVLTDTNLGVALAESIRPRKPPNPHDAGNSQSASEGSYSHRLATSLHKT